MTGNHGNNGMHTDADFLASVNKMAGVDMGREGTGSYCPSPLGKLLI